MKKLLLIPVLFTLLFSLFTLKSEAQWQQTNGPTSGTVRCLALKDSKIFAGTNGGVFVSNDSSSSWSMANNGLLSHYAMSFGVKDSNIFVGTLSCIFRSSDDGANWTQVTAYDAVSFAISGSYIYSASNDQHCLQWRTCQTKSDVSALLLLLNYTALQRQPPAIEAMQSWL